jgi:hypothetical protein
MTRTKALSHPAVGTGRGVRVLDNSTRILDDTPITAIAVDGDDVWILTERRDLSRVRSGKVEYVANLGERTAGCIGVHRGVVYVGGDHARLWRLDEGSLGEVESFQQAPTHAEWHTPWGGPPDVFSIASDGTHLYVSVHVGGILRSTDGVSWEPTIDLHDDVHQVAVGDDATVWAATAMRGLAESNDHGATWRYHTRGPHARYALAVAAVTGGALVAVSSGHAARDGGVYRFDGTHFERCAGLPTSMNGAVGPRQLAAAGELAVVALPNGDVYTSADAGRGWTRAADALSNVTEVAFVPN